MGSMPGNAAEEEAAATSKFRQAASSGARAASTLMLETRGWPLCLLLLVSSMNWIWAVGAGPTAAWKLAKWVRGSNPGKEGDGNMK